MHGCPLRLGPYLEVECMNQSEINFSRTAQSQWFWQGAICHVWTSQLDKHLIHSQKERLAYKLVDEIWLSIGGLQKKHEDSNKEILHRRSFGLTKQTTRKSLVTFGQSYQPYISNVFYIFIDIY